MAVGPASVMPVAAQLRGLLGHDDQMADARRDVLVAARAEIRLARLIGLDAADLDRPVGHLGINAHRRSTATTAKATTTNT